MPEEEGVFTGPIKNLALRVSKRVQTRPRFSNPVGNGDSRNSIYSHL